MSELVAKFQETGSIKMKLNADNSDPRTVQVFMHTQENMKLNKI